MAKYTIKVQEVFAQEVLTPDAAFDILCDKITEAENEGYKLTEISGNQYLLQKDKQSRYINIEVFKVD